MLRLLIISFVLVFAGSVQPLLAQVTNYTFNASSGTFTPLSGATSPSLTSGTADDGYFNGMPIGFDFWYLGVRNTTVSASTNGWITLGANITNSTPANSLASGGAPREVIAPLWDNLDLQAASNFSYLISGSAPNRVLTLQWLNAQWGANASGNTISFQVKLHETSGKIEFIYRQESGSTNSPSASIGITAVAIGSGNYLSLSSAGASPTVSSNSETTTIGVKPANGQTYSFTPPVPTAPSNLTFSEVEGFKMRLNWTDNSNNEDGFVIYKSTDGVNYVYSIQTAAGAISRLESPLASNTTYYWKIYAVAEGGLSTALEGSQATLAIYTVAGTIQDGGGVEIPDVSVNITGSFTGSVFSESGGDGYWFVDLPAGGNYTFTPVMPGYFFTPASYTFNNLSAHQTFTNFVGTPGYTISGHIQDGSGTAISGATVSVSGSQTTSTTTDASGNYSIGLAVNGNYTLTPSKSGYTFSPDTRTYNNLTATQTGADFTGTVNPSYTISGHIQNASAVSISGVTVTLSGGQSGSTTTDSSGNYSFSNVTGGGDYTITPSKTNYTFTPTSLTYNNLSANQTTADFTGTSTFSYTISGHIRNASSIAISGVTVTLSGGQSGSTTTDTSGHYSFAGLPSTNNYTITPSKTNYIFTPADQTHNNLTADHPGANFIGTSVITYTISGHIEDASAVAISGVTVTLTGGQSGSTTTDASGNYSFTDLPSTNNYTVTPSKTNYTFTPGNRTYNNLNSHETNANFTGALYYRVSGLMQDPQGGGIAGVPISVTGDVTDSVTSVCARGVCSWLISLPAGGNYTFTPSKTGYVFNPSSYTFNNLNNDEDADFTGTPAYTISGHIQNASSVAISGVTVSLSGSQTGSTTTDASGNYSFTLAAGGNYTVTPSEANYTFTPTSFTYNNLSANQTTADFTAILAGHTITGHIADAGSIAISGVTVTLSGGQSGTTTTDASGNYSFASLTEGLNYTLTPSKADYAFNPPSLTFNNLAGAQVADFTGALMPNITLIASVSPSGTAEPGTDLLYTIDFSNGGAGFAIAFVITDPVPANTDFKIASVATNLGTTGLTPTISYSNDGGSSWTYSPSSGAGGAPSGYDRNVTNVRWSFASTLSPTSPNNSGSVSYSVRIR
ncbi:MAG TPA: carboxypeptidase regulatory-like domain-containing protein [Pyrinomonadaceae bacterium]